MGSPYAESSWIATKFVNHLEFLILMNQTSRFKSSISKFHVRPASVCRISVKAWVFVALTAFTISTGQAQTWDGGGLATPWSNATNWVGDVAPVANNSLTFAGATQLSTSNDYTAGTQFNGITFASGAGAFVLAGNSINLGGNVTNLSTTGVTISLPLALLQDTTFNTATTGGITVSGVISGTGFDLVKTGSATMTLSGAASNTYTGETKVREGTLTLSFSTLPVNAVNLINTSSALELGGGVFGSSTISMTSRNTATNANSQTFNGTTIKTGTNTISLARGNAAVGNTITLNLGAISREAGGFLQIVGGTNATLGTNAHVDGTRTLSNGIIGGWATYGSNWATISGGDVVAYTGYTVPAGTSPTIASDATSNIQITNTNALTPPAGVTNTAGTAVVTMTDTAGLAAGDAVSGPGVPAGATILSVDSATQITMSVNSRTTPALTSLAVYRPITMAASGTTDINTIQITDSNNRIIDIGSGNTLRLGEFGGIWRNVASIPSLSYGNRVTINGGTLTAGGAPNTAGEIVFNTGGGNDSGNNSSGSRPNRGIVVNSVIANNGTGEVSLVKTGFEALQLNGANTYTGDTHVHRGILESTVANNLGGSGANVYVYNQTDSSAGQVILAGAGDYSNDFYIAGNGTTVTPSSVSFNFGAIAFGNTNATISGDITLLGDSRIGRIGGVTDPAQGFLISGKISGDYQLAFGTGSQQGGVFQLSNTNNDWSGNTLLSISATSGTNLDLRLGASNVLPDGTGKGNIVFGRGSSGGNQVVLSLNGFDETVNALVSTGTPTTESAGYRRVRNTNTTTASTLTVGSGNASGVFFGTVENGGTAVLNLVKSGTGTQELSGTNTYSGTTAVNGGTLLISGTMTGTTGNISVNSGSFVYANAAAMSRNVSVASGATFRYSSDADYGGTLTFANGARLAGTRWLGGLDNQTISNGKIIAPGNSPGLAVGTSQTWGNGGIYEFEMNWGENDFGLAGATFGIGWDLLDLSGALDISGLTSGGFTLELISLNTFNNPAAIEAGGFDEANNYSWKIAEFGSLTGSFSSSLFTIDASGFQNPYTGLFSVSQSGNELYLNYSAIPEPSTYAMLLGGLGLLAFLRRRSKSY
jgi:fibronectin-binding autotransporter adhesin